jgi:hypothetical protein
MAAREQLRAQESGTFCLWSNMVCRERREYRKGQKRNCKESGQKALRPAGTKERAGGRGGGGGEKGCMAARKK